MGNKDNKDNNKKDNEFSKDNGNMEIIKKGEEKKPDTSSSGSGAVSVSKDGINVKKSGNLVIGSLNVMANPIKEKIRDRNERHYRRNKFHLVADILLVLTVLGLVAAFFIIKNWQPQVDMGLEASLKGDYATSGRVETFEIEFKNPSARPVENASISVDLPDNFFLKKTVPSGIFDQASNTFKIGDLVGGGNGKIRLSGLVLGEAGSRQVINLSFNYRSGGKDMNVLDSLVYTIEDSALTVDVDIPDRIFKGVPFRGKLLISNNSSSDLDHDIEIVNRDKGFEIKEISAEQAVLNNNSVLIPGLKAKALKEVDFKALISSVDLDRSVWNLYMNTGDSRILQREKAVKAKVSVPEFKTSISVDKRVVSGGEPINIRVDYDNEEDVDVNDMKMDFRTTDSAFMIKDFKMAKDDRYELYGSGFSFQSPIRSGGSGSLKAKAVLSRRNIKEDQETGISASVSYVIEGKRVEYEIYSGNIKFLSDLQVDSRGVYYSAQGDQLGIGPLPPLVEVPTRYWIFWEANNLGNELKDFSVSAVLPENVYWTDQKSLIAGRLRYGEMSKKVIWNVDEIEAEGGKYRAGFEVELVPGEEDIGKIVDILKDISFSAFDTFAQENISGELPNINTKLEDDSVAAGNGKVKKMNVVR